MFLAQPVTGAPDVEIALSVGNILSLVHHVHGAKDDVVVDVPLVNVGGQHIRLCVFGIHFVKNANRSCLCSFKPLCS